MGLNVNLARKKSAASRKPIGCENPYDGRFGYFAAVTEVHSENNTVHLRTDTGRELMNIGVASMEWVTYKKDGKPPLTGERYLPPVGTYVFCVMPNGRYEDSFVLCSVFSDSAIHADFKGEGENFSEVRERRENGGWRMTTDFRNGTKTVENKTEEPTISVVVDQESEGEEEVAVAVHGNALTVTKDGFEFETDGSRTVTIEGDSETAVKGAVSESVEGDFSLEVKGDAAQSVEGNIELKCSKTGTLEFGNSIDTLGKIVSDVMQQLISLKTVGSPASHTADPGFIAQMNVLKAKWEQIFK